MRKLPLARVSTLFGLCIGVCAVAHASLSAKVNWTIPTARENGQVLAASDLNGYELYYTTDDPKVTGTIKVSGGTTSTYVVQNLVPGNYHFAMSAIDTTGLKSKLSTVVDVTLAAPTSTSVPSSTTASGTTTATGATASVGAGTGSSASSGGGTTTGAITATNTSNTSATSSTASNTANTAATVALKSVKVSWKTPTTRVDGTPLSVSDLSGYKINVYYYKTGAYIAKVSVSGASVNNYSISNMQPGAYLVALFAIDKNGARSPAVYSLISVGA